MTSINTSFVKLSYRLNNEHDIRGELMDKYYFSLEKYDPETFELIGESNFFIEAETDPNVDDYDIYYTLSPGNMTKDDWSMTELTRVINDAQSHKELELVIMENLNYWDYREHIVYDELPKKDSIDANSDDDESDNNDDDDDFAEHHDDNEY